LSKGKIRAGIVAVTVGAVLGVSGFAFAMFSESTSTSAEGQVANMVPLEVVKDSSHVVYANSETKLWPGTGHEASVTFKVKNPNEVGVAITNIVLKDAKVSGTGCGENLRILGVPASTAANVPVPAAKIVATPDLVIDKNNTETLDVTLTGIVTLDGAAQTPCESVSFTANFVVTGTST